MATLFDGNEAGTAAQSQQVRSTTPMSRCVKVASAAAATIGTLVASQIPMASGLSPTDQGLYHNIPVPLGSSHYECFQSNVTKAASGYYPAWTGASWLRYDDTYVYDSCGAGGTPLPRAQGEFYSEVWKGYTNGTVCLGSNNGRYNWANEDSILLTAHSAAYTCSATNSQAKITGFYHNPDLVGATGGSTIFTHAEDP